MMDEKSKDETERLHDVISKALEQGTKDGVGSDALFYAVMYHLINVANLVGIPREELLASVGDCFDNVEGLPDAQ